uniref:Uncharacterized protein n=1 Tax=Davidia involucrata TaxID=16924 RepID=A0A5B7BHV7_DAVIN
MGRTVGRTITDLHFDLLMYIMIFVAKSSNGAANLARAISVSRVFMKVAEDRSVLQAVVFANVRVSHQYELFQQINGLLSRCAQAGNVAAQYLLAQIILLSSSQLQTRVLVRGSSKFSSRGRRLTDKACSGIIPKEDSPVVSFMAHFVPDQQACACKTSSCHRSLPHYELVKLFLRRCSPYDLTKMRLHLNHYLDYFIGRGNGVHLILNHSINHMCSIGDRVLGIAELGEIKRRVNAQMRHLTEAAMASRSRNVNPFLQKERSDAIEAGIARCGATVLELRVKCAELGLSFEVVFGANSNLEAYVKYFCEVLTLYEEHRIIVYLAFNRFFP